MKKSILKKITSFALALVLCVGLLPVTAFAAGDVSYVDEANTDKTCVNYTEITDSTATWGAESTETWYVASATATITDRVTVYGDVKLILADGVTLTAGNSIEIKDGASLTIYGQSSQTGSLLVTPESLANAYYNGINLNTTGEVILNGGNLSTQGDWNHYAAIGAGRENGGGVVTVNRGTLVATGGNSSAFRTTLYVNGGTVTAIGGNDGTPCFSGELHLSGGSFEAKGHANQPAALSALPTSTTRMKMEAGAATDGSDKAYVAYSGWGTALQSAKYVRFTSCSAHMCSGDAYCDHCNLEFPDVAANPAAGNYTTNQEVVLTPASGTMDVYYTIDGSDPFNASTEKYTAPIQITGVAGQEIKTTIKAYAVPAGDTRSDGPVSTFEYTVSLEAIETYDLWVGGVQVTSAIKDNITEAINAATPGAANGSASFDPDTNTLTLDGFSYTGAGYAFEYFSGHASAAAIYSELAALTIATANTSSVSHNLQNNYTYGIYTAGDLVVTGNSTATLTASGSTTNARSVGIYIHDGDLTVSGGTLIGTGNNGNTNADSCGIWCFNGDVTVNSGAKLTGNSGIGEISYGITVFGKLTVNGGTVEGTAGTGYRIGIGITTDTVESSSENSQIIGMAGSADESAGIYIWMERICLG